MCGISAYAQCACLEMELIHIQMAQKPMLQEVAYAPKKMQNKKRQALRPDGFAVCAEPVRRPGEVPGGLSSKNGRGRGRNARGRCTNVVGLAV
jgi:hypothetical protein